MRRKLIAMILRLRSVMRGVPVLSVRPVATAAIPEILFPWRMNIAGSLTMRKMLRWVFLQPFKSVRCPMSLNNQPDVAVINARNGCTASTAYSISTEQLVNEIKRATKIFEQQETERWKAMIRREAPGMDADNTAILFHTSARNAVTRAYPFLPKFVMFSPVVMRTEMLFVAMPDIQKWPVFDEKRDIAPLSRSMYQPDSEG